MNNLVKQNGNFSLIKENGTNPGMSPAYGLITENLISVLWRNRWVMFVSVIVFLLAALIYVIKATPIYTSTSRVYVEQSGPKIITEMEEGVMTQSKNYLYTQAELLKSTPILSDVLDITSTKQMNTFNDVDNLLIFLKKNLDVTVGKKDDIISISFNSPFPVEVAQIVNEVVDSYITYHATQKRSTSSEVLKILKTEKDKRNKELADKLKSMMEFKKENEALAFESKQGNIVIERFARLSSVLTEAQLSTIESKSIYESTKEMISDPIKLSQFIENQRAKGIYSSIENEKALLKTNLERLELRLSDRLRQVKKGHPAVKSLESDIAKIKEQIAKLDTDYAMAQLAIAEQQYNSAKEKEEQIAAYYEQQRQTALALNEQLAQFTLLQSAWEQTKKLCDILDDRIKELNVTEDIGALNISILEVARPADRPSEPRKGRYMALGLVMGLVSGGGIAVFRCYMDQKLHSADEIAAVLNMPVLGLVPSMSKRERITERGRKVHLDSKSPWAESYRTIRTAVFFGAPQGEIKTILITSPAPSDGKSTMVSNLAITMAQSGQKTLILDADFRKPMQHNIFGIRNHDAGLSSVLAGMTKLHNTILSTGIKRLDLLTRGPDVPNPSETLNSKIFAKLLKILSTKYDRVIIDSPPVMPVTDAQILAAISDITILVLRAEKSTRKISQQARDGLLSVGARFLGVVVNDVPKKGGYGYGYGYYYGHYGTERRKKRRISDIRTETIVGKPKEFSYSN